MPPLSDGLCGSSAPLARTPVCPPVLPRGDGFVSRRVPLNPTANGRLVNIELGRQRGDRKTFSKSGLTYFVNTGSEHL